MTHGSLFAGIGGFDLGFERAGFETLWQVEIDDYCRKVLEKNFPKAERFGDINECFPELTSSAAASLASTSPTLANAPELPESIRDSGGQWCVPFAWYDRSTQLWRTWQLCLDGEWAEFSETWPRAGMTANGIAYQRQPLAPLTAVIESLLWPTPTEHVKHNRQTRYAQGGTPLSLAVRIWPTPRAHEHGQYQRDRGQKGKERPTLTGAVKCWPTPRPQPRGLYKGKPGDRDRSRLEETVARSENTTSGQLNPTWVEWLMGFPLGWTALKDSVTPSSRKSPSGSPRESESTRKANNCPRS